LSTDVSEVRAASIITLLMEAARTSETSVDNYFTRHYNPEEKSELYTRRRENLKYHTLTLCFSPVHISKMVLKDCCFNLLPQFYCPTILFTFYFYCATAD
jgi:hypothetical protein